MYQGEIRKQGDSVIIRGIPDITIEDHHIGDKVNYERPTATSVTLLIDKGKRWGIALDDVVAVQTDLPLLNTWTDAASMDMKVSIETSFLTDSTIYAGMDSYNTGLTCGVISQSYNMGTVSAPVQITSSNVLDYIIDSQSILMEQNVTLMKPWMIIPTWMAGMIKKSDLKDASLTGDGQSTLRTGQIGSIDGVTLYSSNLLYHSSTTYYVAMFGTSAAITFATQIVKTQHLPAPSEAFEERVRGLQVYGYKVVKDEAYGALICYK